MEMCNPAAYDPVLVSPCKRRQDTGKPCPLIYKPKYNPYCESCGILMPGLDRFVYPAELLKEMLKENLIEFGNAPPRMKKQERVKLIRCSWENERDGRCKEMIGKGLYCQMHGRTVTSRKTQWKRSGKKGEAPLEYLVRPLEMYGMKLHNERKKRREALK